MNCDELLGKVLFGEPLSPEEQAHARDCPQCAPRVDAARRAAASLASVPAPEIAPDFQARVLREARPWLERNRRRALVRSIAWTVGAALLPLPFVVALDVLLLRAMHGLMQQFLPGGVSLVVVAGQAGLVALLLALTYGAIPLLVERQLRARPGGHHA